jgi:S1-C subfamily serine protease
MDKITIRPEDLPSPQRERIRIEPQHLTQSAAPVEAAEAAQVVVAQLVPIVPRRGLPWPVWLAVTLVPGLNAWCWWRYAPARQPQRRLCRAAAVVLGVASLVGLGWVVVWARWPQRDWVEVAAERAQHSVVMIRREPDALGSGFVVATDGRRQLILTNRHVLDGAERCEVLLLSGETAAGRLAGLPRDGEIDLALVLAEAHGLRPLGRIGRFGRVRVGEAVAAIGHPLGLHFTVTTGVVSAKRGGVELQTSAPISPGNSGGPLINRDGYVVGVNTRVIDPQSASGLGFAVRSDVVLDAGVWSFREDVSELMAGIPQ